MNPYYTRGGITIYHANCLDAIAYLIQAGTVVDLIATDPAYRCISGGNTPHPDHQRCSGILANNDGKIFEHNDISTADYAGLFYQVLRDPSHCYLMINVLNLEDALRDFREAGFKLHNVLPWIKNNVTPNRWYMKDTEYILFFHKGAAFSINDPSSKMSQNFPNPRVKQHPTEKPEMLMRRFIQNSSKAGDLILDPFMGSGSTLEAAYRSKCRAIGIDIDLKYCEVSARRLDALMDGRAEQIQLFQIAA